MGTSGDQGTVVQISVLLSVIAILVALLLELLSFRHGLGQVRDNLVAFGSSSADNPVLGLSIRRSPALWSSIRFTLGRRLSAISSSGQEFALFPLHFHDIDSTRAIRRLYSWLPSIIHRRSPAYSSISTQATTHSADAPDTFNSPHLTARVRRVAQPSHPDHPTNMVRSTR